MINSKLKEILEEEYLIKVDKIEKNEDSTDGNVFIINSNNKKYVVKIYENIDHTKAMVYLHQYLIDSLQNIPKIILSNNNEPYITLSDNKYIVVYSFMSGSQIKCYVIDGKIDDSAIISKIAKALRKLHDATNIENRFELPKVPFEINKELDRYSVLHFDLTNENIFIDEFNNIGFIDFDDAKYGPTVCDVAILVALLFFSKTKGADTFSAYKFIDEYYYNEPQMKEKEVPYIKEIALKWIDYILNNNQFDTSTTESFVVKRKLVDENLLL